MEDFVQLKNVIAQISENFLENPELYLHNFFMHHKPKYLHDVAELCLTAFPRELLSKNSAAFVKAWNSYSKMCLNAEEEIDERSPD